MQHWTCLYEIWTNTETYVFRRTIPIFLQNYSLAKRTATALPSSWKKINQYITLQQNNLLLALYSNKQKITKTTTTIYLETDIRLCPILYKLTTTKNTPQFTQPETLETWSIGVRKAWTGKGILKKANKHIHKRNSRVRRLMF